MTIRRAKTRDGTPIEPMTLGNMRSLGVRCLEAICAETLLRRLREGHSQ